MCSMREVPQEEPFNFYFCYFCVCGEGRMGGQYVSFFNFLIYIFVLLKMIKND